MNLHDFKRRLSIIGMLLITISAIFLYLGSKPMPWEYQTWEGNSFKEIEYRTLRFTEAHFGLLLLAAGSLFQLIYLVNCKDISWIIKKVRRNNK